tara:strand:- start:7525 stop:9306 length:1782 start_codon:yes stop_codon:yes gene_type:complete
MELERFLDLIAEELIRQIDSLPGGGTPEGNRSILMENQKTIRSGLVRRFRTEEEQMLVYQSDIKANKEDFNTTNSGEGYGSFMELFESALSSDTVNDENVTITAQINSSNGQAQVTVAVQGAPGSPWDLTPFIFPNDDDGINNPLNISQFIQFQDKAPLYNTGSIHEYFDTNIYELLPQQRTRQQRINDFFAEYQTLKGEYPSFADYSVPEDFLIEPEDGYEGSHDIAYIQDNPFSSSISEQTSFITRLNIDTNDENRNKTLEYLRDDLDLFLKDIDQDTDSILQDDRPNYENKSEGFLKIRNLNQGIIIRKQEGDDVGIEKEVLIPTIDNQQHYFGDTTPNDSQYYHPYFNDISGEFLIPGGYGPSYLTDGFTITMWVKFLDRTTRGTLFNYGNPLRGYDPKGFKLETFVLNKYDPLPSTKGYIREDGYETWGEVATTFGNSDLFKDGEYERFIRLVVIDHIDKGFENQYTTGKLYDSHLGIQGFDKQEFVPEFSKNEDDDGAYSKGDEIYLLTHTRIPIDFNEWYYIVATYDPMINNEQVNEYLQDTDYWRGNKTITGDFTNNSGRGTKCKVEIISKTDLLRARGYAPEET